MDLPVSGVAAATEQALRAAGRADTPLGQTAILIAQTLGSGLHPATGVAALSKELRATLAEALANAKSADDSLDELSKRRAKKAGSA